MKTLNILKNIAVILFAMFLVQCEQDSLQAVNDNERLELRAKPGGEATGNNLSFPVIWSDGPPLALPGTPEMIPVLTGNWWYVWGPDPIDPQSPIYSCQPDPEASDNCLDGTPPGETDLFKAWLQKDPGNLWQAANWTGDGMPTNVDWIDWGDNLESVDWTLRSQIRTEVVLYKDLEMQVTEYLMKHVSGWGTDEVHGLATDLNNAIMYGPGYQATVYSNKARLTIQKLNVPREQLLEGQLIWVPESGWTEADGVQEDLINEAIYNTAYSAEVNVKGKVIFGYTWNARRNNDGAGDYRITFSLDPTGCNTSLTLAQLILPEEELPEESSEEGGGAVPVLIGTNNLTYIDIRLSGGPSGGKGKGQGGN